jgi:low temperature requirement protein LtrA
MAQHPRSGHARSKPAPSGPARFAIRTRMSGRDIGEKHRASTPLELLFDLSFVVAVAQVASQLAHSIAHATLFSGGILGYLMVFFAIWWAWINFTWFASAYDTDDVPYRLLTLLQIAGVLVLAAGVPSAFSQADFTAVTVGYVIMRVALVGQWLRAAHEHSARRSTAYRYAGGVTAVQVLWVARLFLPASLGVAGFFVAVIADVAVPIWAERTGSTPWHPHHIAERYGLFTIILLGESVSATALAVQGFLASHALDANLIIVAFAGLVLIFALWWLYFKEPAGDGLSRHRRWAFVWGYGHYFLFASVAAIGAALEAAIDSGSAEFHAPATVVGYAVAIPVACFFITLYWLNLPVIGASVSRGTTLGLAAIVVLLIPLAAPVFGIAAIVSAVALVAAVLVVVATKARTQ